jgi:hypothetical protein
MNSLMTGLTGPAGSARQAWSRPKVALIDIFIPIRDRKRAHSGRDRQTGGGHTGDESEQVKWSTTKSLLRSQ